MKNLILLLLFTCIHLFVFSQPNTEVFLFDLNTENEKFELSNFKNISNNEGYDNQPSFLDDNTILFASTRNGQTDIAKYSINYESKIYINHSEGSEYSPLKIPNQYAVSAIRLDKDGKQLLYSYSLSNGEFSTLIEDLVIGYHVWLNNNTVLSSVLDGKNLSLYSSNINTKTNRKLEENIGRSLHKIPNSNLISFVSKKDSLKWKIKSINPVSGAIKHLKITLHKTEDYCWLPNGTLLMGKDDKLYTYKPKRDSNWIEIASLTDFGIENISRLAISPNGTKLAIVGETNNVLEPKLENIAWISGTWKGEAFGGITEEIWSEPSGGSMMATFKLINDGKVSFYEIEIIREIENSLILQLKHFGNDLKGWETKDETVDFPLKEITTNKVVFEGMTFERVSDNEMNIYVDIHNDDGTIDNVKFNYKKD